MTDLWAGRYTITVRSTASRAGLPPRVSSRRIVVMWPEMVIVEPQDGAIYSSARQGQVLLRYAVQFSSGGPYAEQGGRGAYVTQWGTINFKRWGKHILLGSGMQ